MGRNLLAISDKQKMTFLSLISFLLFLISVPTAQADTSCQPIYGGGQSCVTTNNIIVDKTILNPKTNQLVDNLGINDPKYQPDFITTFQIKVTNTGNNLLPSVEVKDIFPQYVSFSSGPGNFDSNTRTLTFPVINLEKNESRVFTILGRIADEKSIPLANGNICVVNQALATTSTNEAAQDNAQFCIEKKEVSIIKGGFPVFAPVPTATTPATGPEVLSLFALIPTGLTGWFLRKKSIKNNI